MPKGIDMDKYVEQFEIPYGSGKIGASISKDEDGFKPWCGGCGIGKAEPTINGARQTIFNHVQIRLKGIKVDAENVVKQSEKSLAILGNDLFNLGQFKLKG